MGYVHRVRVSATATTSGNATQSFYTPIVNGHLERIVFRNGTASGLSTNAHMNIIAENGGFTMLSVTTTGATGAGSEIVSYSPRGIAQNISATNLAFEENATAPSRIPVLFPVADERIQIEISSASNTSVGGRSFRLDFYISGQ